MAIIANQAPPPAPESAPSRRVIVKLHARLPRRAVLEALSQNTALPNLTESFPGVSIRPYFEESLPAAATTQILSTESAPATSVPAGGTVFDSFLAIDVPAGTDPRALARSVGDRSDVEIAYVEGGPPPPPVTPDNNPLAANQGYLVQAPGGIDARWAWSVADGSGIGFVDVEQGWTLDHEDLAAAKISIISGLNQAYPGHGTAVLGEVVAVDNNLGIIGIAPAAATRVVSQWRTAGRYHTPEAILSALGVMRAGDVMLLEAQTTYATVPGYLPVEVEDAVFEAIRTATASGVVVIEAGGNGNIDLDAFVDMKGRRILNRASSDFRDSGAIMLGAASAAAPHARLSFSNFGSRIDCFAWGELIETCGDGWTGDERNSYTPGFGGTSGASPIVTGAAIVLQSWVRQHRHCYSAAEIRNLLSHSALNTASASPALDRIGVMPNLKAIIEWEAIRLGVAAVAVGTIPALAASGT